MMVLKAKKNKFCKYKDNYKRAIGKGLCYYAFFTNKKSDLLFLKTLYPSIEIKEGIYVFDWWLYRVAIYDLNSGIDLDYFEAAKVNKDKERVIFTQSKFLNKAREIWKDLKNSYDNE